MHFNSVFGNDNFGGRVVNFSIRCFVQCGSFPAAEQPYLLFL